MNLKSDNRHQATDITQQAADSKQQKSGRRHPTASGWEQEGGRHQASDSTDSNQQT